MKQIVTEPALDEVHFGERWQGQDFDTLNRDEQWRKWNAVRSFARTAGGESMIDVQARAMAVVERLVAEHVQKTVALVSHSEIIKAVVSHVLGLPIDAWPRFEIAPASITTIVVGPWGGKILTLNEVIA